MIYFLLERYMLPNTFRMHCAIISKQLYSSSDENLLQESWGGVNKKYYHTNRRMLNYWQSWVDVTIAVCRLGKNNLWCPTRRVAGSGRTDQSQPETLPAGSRICGCWRKEVGSAIGRHFPAAFIKASYRKIVSPTLFAEWYHQPNRGSDYN